MSVGAAVGTAGPFSGFRAFTRLFIPRDAETIGLLEHGTAELQAAFGELRRLVCGLDPAIRTDAGLVPALCSLAQGKPLTARLNTSIGSGSGLRDRVSALGCTVTVHSEPGRGTCVVADIPAGES